MFKKYYSPSVYQICQNLTGRSQKQSLCAPLQLQHPTDGAVNHESSYNLRPQWWKLNFLVDGKQCNLGPFEFRVTK